MYSTFLSDVTGLDVDLRGREGQGVLGKGPGDTLSSLHRPLLPQPARERTMSWWDWLGLGPDPNDEDTAAERKKIEEMLELVVSLQEKTPAMEALVASHANRVPDEHTKFIASSLAQGRKAIFYGTAYLKRHGVEVPGTRSEPPAENGKLKTE
jgi:hypothetical protein